MAVKRKYRLNLRNYGNLPAIMLSQYDEGYALEFEIRDGTEAASDLSAYTVTLKGTRADTLAYSFAGTIANNVLTFVIDTTMTACAGRGTAEIAIKDTANDVLFATFNMPVFVERAAVPEGSIDADVERAQEIAEQVQEIVDNAAASIGIDATLTQAGKAADAKKTGDEISDLKENLNKLTTATAEDVGKALKAKTVTNGKVTDWEFGETGDNEAIESLNEQMEMLINKTETAPSTTGVSIQCVDLAVARYDRDRYWDIVVRLPYVGRYDYNPSNLNLTAFYLKAKNKNGDNVAMYKNGSATSGMSFPTKGYFVLENRRTLKAYTSASVLNDTYTFDDDVYTLYNGMIGYVTSGSGQPVGITWGEPSETYITFDSSVFDDITYTYDYAKALDEHVTTIVDETHDIFAQSENLLDYAKIDWVSSGYHSLVNGYYMQCAEGDVLVCNRDKVYYIFFDSTRTKLSSVSVNIRIPVTVPSDAVWFRMTFNVGYTSEGDEIMVWKARSVESAPFERPIYRPYQKYVAKYADSDIFDFAVPTSLTQGVMKWARFVAIRALNESRDAFRFGTFNTYVSIGMRGFPVIREMLFNHCIDFCGFQECNYPVQIASAVYPWQFPYNTGARASNYDGVPAVSRFEVVNVSTTTLEESSGHSVKKITVNLPRNKHYRVATLSVFNYHGTLSSAQVSEARQIVAMVNQDNADFKIIMGDTNDGGAEKAAWNVFESAGFTAVHHGESPTWPSEDGQSRYESEDNIFVGPNINVLHYDIIRTGTGEITLEDGTTTLSDHNFLFADLQFDFDTVLKDTWTRL